MSAEQMSFTAWMVSALTLTGDVMEILTVSTRHAWLHFIIGSIQLQEYEFQLNYPSIITTDSAIHGDIVLKIIN